MLAASFSCAANGITWATSRHKVKDETTEVEAKQRRIVLCRILQALRQVPFSGHQPLDTRDTPSPVLTCPCPSSAVSYGICGPSLVKPGSDSRSPYRHGWLV